MNGPQDLGGTMGFGPVAPEKDEPVFHAAWEKRALAVTLAMGAAGQWTLDAARHARESLPPAEYLSSSYYEIWIAALETLMIDRRLVTRDELATGRMRETAKPVAGKLLAENVAQVLAAGKSTSRPVAARRRYAIGDRVRARNMHPPTHTRLPRYLRGHTGEIVLLHGAHVFPDTNAHGQGEAPQHLYTVRFSARDVWGEDHPVADSVSADLFESYLEPA